jgi:hypothetical protein
VFPPAGALEDVGDAVAVEVADTEAVREALILLGFGWRDGDEFCWLGRVERVEFRIPDGPARHADQVRSPVPVEVDQVRRFVVGAREEEVPFPRRRPRRTGVLIPVGFFAREAHRDYVRLAVAVEVGDELHE